MMSLSVSEAETIDLASQASAAANVLVLAPDSGTNFPLHLSRHLSSRRRA